MRSLGAPVRATHLSLSSPSFHAHRISSQAVLQPSARLSNPHYPLFPQHSLPGSEMAHIDIVCLCQCLCVCVLRLCVCAYACVLSCVCVLSLFDGTTVLMRLYVCLCVSPGRPDIETSWLRQPCRKVTPHPFGTHSF